MADREAIIRAFLDRAGWAGATRRPLAGDASFRRYDRVTDTAGGRRAVLMDAPPGKEDVRPFLAVDAHLRAQGLSAPEVLAADAEAGLVLLEDLGDALYTRVLDAGEGDEATLYAAAVDVLAALHARPPEGLDPPPYDDDLLMAEVALFIDWFLPAATGAAVDDATRDAFRAAWRAVFPLARAAPPRLTLRDYHADNLIWLPARAGLRRVGLLDFQDAVLGAPAYDLVSLLEDARRDVAPETVAAMRARYLAARPETDADAFDAAYAMLGAQRNCKIVGIFTRLWRRDGKPAYLDHLPRVWAHLARDLAHPTLAPLRAWFDEAAPPRLRTRPDQCP